MNSCIVGEWSFGYSPALTALGVQFIYLSMLGVTASRPLPRVVCVVLLLCCVYCLSVLLFPAWSEFCGIRGLSVVPVEITAIRMSLLTVMCQITRYPAAYPLRTLTAKSVVHAYQKSRVKFFLAFVCTGIKSAEHQAQPVLLIPCAKPRGAGTFPPLKSLHVYCVHMSAVWKDGLQWLLLAAREVAQESTGFNPN